MASGFGPHRVDRRESAIPGVLVVVHEHVGGRTLGDAIFRRYDLRVSIRQLDRERFREGPNLLLHRSAHDGHVNVNAAGAGRLRVAFNFDRGQRVPYHQSGFEDVLERCAGGRIKVKVEIVGTLDVVAARVPGIQIDAPQIDDPQEQRRRVLNHGKIDYIAWNDARWNRWESTGGRDVGRALHKKELAYGNPVWIALHYHGAILNVRQKPGRDGEIILQQKSRLVRPNSGQNTFCRFVSFTAPPSTVISASFIFRGT